MRNKILHTNSLQLKPLIFPLIFAVMGTIIIIRSFAAPSPNAKVSEAESYTTTQNVSIVADASASGLSYVQFDAENTGGAVQKNCAAVPSQCGYPDSMNTGPAPSTVYKRVPQDITSGTGWEWEANFGRLRVAGNGAVLNGLQVDGPVVIDAPNVTISNNVIKYCNTEGDIIALRAGNIANGYNGNFATIRNNKLYCDQPTTNRSRSGVRDVYGAAQGAQIIANDISGTGNGITLDLMEWLAIIGSMILATWLRTIILVSARMVVHNLSYTSITRFCWPILLRLEAVGCRGQLPRMVILHTPRM